MRRSSRWLTLLAVVIGGFPWSPSAPADEPTPPSSEKVAAAPKLPTVAEYRTASERLLRDDEDDNDHQAYHRLGCLTLIAGRNRPAIEQARDFFRSAYLARPEEAHYLYLQYRSEFELAAMPFQDPEVKRLYNLMIEQDVRYYVHAGSDRLPDVEFLVLLLEDDQWSAASLAALKTLPTPALVTLLSYLKFPYYSETPVETKLLQAIAGREPELVPAAQALLKNLNDVQWPLLEKRLMNLVQRDVDVFTPAERAQLRLSGLSALRLRQNQLDGVTKAVSPAMDYLRSRIKLVEGILQRAAKLTAEPPLDPAVVAAQRKAAKEAALQAFLDQLRGVIREGGQAQREQLAARLATARQAEATAQRQPAGPIRVAELKKLSSDIQQLTKAQDALAADLRQGVPPLALPLKVGALGTLPGRAYQVDLVSASTKDVLVTLTTPLTSQAALLRGVDRSKLKARETYPCADVFLVEPPTATSGKMPVLIPLKDEFVREAQRLEAAPP